MKNLAFARWFLGSIILFGLAGRLITGQVAYTRLAYVSILVLVTSLAWSLISLRGIRMHREARLFRASVGEVFEEHFELSTTSWLGCIWLEIVNLSTLPMASGSRLLTGIAARQKRFYSSRTLLTQRGSYLLGPTLLSSGDPFGLFPCNIELPATETLVVLPLTVNISTFPPPPGLLPGGKAIHQKTMDVTPHAAGIREYVPGDAMKRIHWPSTAKRGQFMVKEFEQDPQSDIWIFLDAQRLHHHYIGSTSARSISEEGFLLRRPKVDLPCDSFEYSISIAASLAQFFLFEKRAIGLVCASNHFTVLSAERGERQLGKVLETLAFLQPDGEMSLLGLVTMQGKLLPLGSGVIMVTAAASPDLFIAVTDLQRRHLSPLVVLLKSDTFGGSPAADTLVAGLINQGVPVCQIGFRDDLGTKLSLPAAHFQGNIRTRAAYFPRS